MQNWAVGVPGRLAFRGEGRLGVAPVPAGPRLRPGRGSEGVGRGWAVVVPGY